MYNIRLYHVTRTPSNGHVIQSETHDNNTALPLVGVLVTLIILSIISMKN